jgi:hypothetical protein
MTDKGVSSGRGILEVVSSADHETWPPVVEQISRVFEVAPHPVSLAPPESDAGGRTRVDRVLELAGEARGPILLLPPSVAAGPPREPRHGGLRHVIVASDATEPVTGAVAALYERLADAGVSATIVVVTTPTTLPRIWEGVGYNAQAWRDELRHRHGSAGAHFSVIGGEPAPQLRAAAAHADVLILPWRQGAESGRTAVSRALLAEDLYVPCLLVPLAWARVLPRAASRLAPAEGLT